MVGSSKADHRRDFETRDIDRANVQINFTESEHESKLVADIPLAPKRPTRKPF
jgi:hypothetical protein